MKHQFIDDQRRRYGVRRLCASLDVSRSGYYAARGQAAERGIRAAHGTDLADSGLFARQAVETYGSPRVHAELHAQGIPCC